MIRVRHKGNFVNTTKFLERAKKGVDYKQLKSICEKGVKALSSVTPVDTGKTANSWYSSITKENGVIKLSFNNSNIQNGVPIAIILQYGHATKNDGWVEGRDYINPAIAPIFDEILDSAWKEVTKK